jgi:hypothetical protein
MAHIPNGLSTRRATRFRYLEAGIHHWQFRVRVQPPAIALAKRAPVEFTQFILKTSACDCTCESKGNAGLREAMKPPPLRRRFPRPSHRINVLTRILSPCIAWRCLRMERAMGIENVALETLTSLNHEVASDDDRCV